MYINPETLCVYGSARVTPGAELGGHVSWALDKPLMPAFLSTLEKAVHYAEAREVEETRKSLDELNGYNSRARL